MFGSAFKFLEAMEVIILKEYVMSDLMVPNAVSNTCSAGLLRCISGSSQGSVVSCKHNQWSMLSIWLVV